MINFLRKLKRTKTPEEILNNVQSAKVTLRRTIGPIELIALGIGAIIGAGIFVITGTAAAGNISAAGEILRIPAGPAIVLSFVITAIGCCCCALCYAEFASSVPISGSAYTYAYVSMGEIFAWIIGWDLLLEYTFDAATVAIGWSGYMQAFLEWATSSKLPEYLLTPTFTAMRNPSLSAGFAHIGSIPLCINLPAMGIIAMLTLLLIRGIKESARVNTIIVVLKLIIICTFIFVGAKYVKPELWTPFMPYGIRGVIAGASMIFFAYIGFDALSTVSEEVKNPTRTLPIGIIGSLVICTVLYIIVAAILTGMVPFKILNTPDPVATALNAVGETFLGSFIVSLGAVIALISTLLVFLLGQPRIIFSMARDGFFPKVLTKVHPKFRTPMVATIISGSVIALLAGVGDLSNVASLCNAGTLTAFMMVAVGIIIMRRRPVQLAGFRVPFVPFIPILGAVICLGLFIALPTLAKVAFVVWTIIGLFIYFGYGIRHTKN